jgi:hypothetical protein
MHRLTFGDDDATRRRIWPWPHLSLERAAVLYRTRHSPMLFRRAVRPARSAAFLRTGRSGALRATVPHGCNPDRNAEFDSQRLGCSE